MSRITRRMIGTIVGVALLAGGAGASAQTNTTTTTTTTTTIPPHPFSSATAACLAHARRGRRACQRAETPDCRTPYETAYASCFEAGAGVSCAKRCITRETTCFANAPKTRRTCGRTCFKTRTRDVRACRQIPVGDKIWAGGDGSCLATADASYHLCQFVCAQTALDCRTTRRFCVANCANL